MQKRISNTESAITLILGLVCLYASRAYAMPVAALLSPVFMIRYLRTRRLLPGSLILATAASLTMVVAFRGLNGAMFNSTAIYCVVMIVTTVIGLIPVILDRYYSARISTWTLTLIYPSLKTFLEYAGSLNSPFGEWGSGAALFAGWLPLSQIVSITGIWGLSFLICWFASTVNFVWDKKGLWNKTIPAVTPFFATILLVTGYSTLKLANKDLVPNVKVAAVLANDTLQFIPKKDFYRQLEAFGKGRMSADSIHYFNERFAESNHFLLEQTGRAATEGAKIIFWAEGNGMVIKPNESSLIQHASALAVEKKIYLGMSVEVFNSREKNPVENKIILFKPDGSIAWEYFKHFPVGIENETMVKGTGGIKTLQTPYGKIAAVICFDSDFIRFAREAGKANADILFAPSNDWQAIAVFRGKITRFRALENGVTLVRPTSHGVTEMVDSKGKMIFSNNYFENPDTILLADVPVKSSSSFYAFIGDWFALVSIIIFLIVIAFEHLRTRKNWLIRTKTLLIFILFSILSVSLHAQSSSADSGRKNKTILIPAISFSPETSVAMGASMVKLVSLDHSDKSQINSTALYTFNNQFLLDGKANLYFSENKFMTTGNFKFSKYPEYYYGIGNNTLEDSKNMVAYYVLQLEASLMRRVAAHLYAGPKINYSNYFNVRPVDDLGTTDGKTGGVTTGLGVKVVYDTRDDILTSSGGFYAEVSSLWNTTALGGDFSYRCIDADIRKFIRLSKNTVVGVHGLVQLKAGNVPFLQLSYLGGSNIMRGYYAGRYRDNNMLAMQAEVRQQLSRKWAVAGFVGYGEVLREMKEISFYDLHTCIGGGFRRRLSKTEKVNLRMDVGFANGKPCFYVNISEAF